MDLPFNEYKEEDFFIREFSSGDSHHFYWHRDREDRIIESIGDTDWQIQIDNELPKKIEGKIFIKSGVYHRVISGSGDLKIKLWKI